MVAQVSYIGLYQPVLSGISVTDDFVDIGLPAVILKKYVGSFYQ